MLEVKKICITKDTLLSEVLKKINETALGIVFIIDEERKLIGVLSDGDIRRALLKDNSLNNTVDLIYNRNYFSLPVDTVNEKIIRSFNDQIKIIPLVDSNGIIVDYATPKKLRNIPIANPLLDGNELAYVTDCVSTAWISSQGKYVKTFEEQFIKICKMPDALAVSNGTVALHLALVALGVGPGDEVIVPDLTFAATVNTVIHAGATPVLAEVDNDTWTLSPDSFEKLITPKTKAVMPVHLYGHPADMDAINKIAKKYNILVIEDCAEALGSLYKNEPVGSLSDASTFSFFGNKTITTGEGGMVLFKNPDIAKKARILRDHGMSPEKRYWHMVVGYNYRMTNIQAALGVAQMERLNRFVEAKRNIAAVYNEILKKSSHIILPPEMSWAQNSYWLYTFYLKNTCPINSEELRSRLSRRGIETRPVFYPLHKMPPYENLTKDGDLKNSQDISAKGISLPSYVQLSSSECDFIAHTILELIS